MPPSALAGSHDLPPSEAVPAQADHRRSLQAADDSLLIARIAEQDRRAFDVLYRRYYTRLFHFVKRRVRCEALVDEIVNDSMLVLWQSARSFEGASSVLTWLFGIAHRQALRALHRSRRHSIIESNDDLVADTADGHPGMNPESVAITDSDGMLLAKGVELLSEHQRIVVELTATGHSSIEIAEMTGSLENTVRTRIFHARQHLQRFLARTAKAASSGEFSRAKGGPRVAKGRPTFREWIQSFGAAAAVLD